MRQSRDNTYRASGQPMNSDRDFLGRAVSLAASSAEAGGFPCGAVVVLAGRVLGEGRSRSVATADPTAHAEIEAIRAAAARQGAGRLAGATLYSALEPCLMCLHAAYWAGFVRIVYGNAKLNLSPEYYEGSGALSAAAAALNRTILIEHLAGFEGESRDLVLAWKKGRGNGP